MRAPINKETILKTKKEINFTRALKITKKTQTLTSKQPLIDLKGNSKYNFLLLNKFGNTINYKTNPYNFNLSSSNEISTKIDDNKIIIRELGKENKTLSKQLINIVASDYNNIKQNNPSFNRVQIINQLRGLYIGKNETYTVVTGYKELNINFNHTHSLPKLKYILTLINTKRITKSAYNKLTKEGVNEYYTKCKLEDSIKSKQEFLAKNL